MSDRSKGERIQAFVVTVLLVAGASGHAENWPQWRGSTHNGASDETGLPATWEGPGDAAWTAELPGPSSSTPVIWGDRVFLTSNDATRTKLYGLCLDRNTGAELWRKQFSESARASARNDMASCSPATDGKLVYFTFADGGMYALDFDGNEVWSRDLTESHGPVDLNHGFSSSPLIYKGRLYLPILHGQWTKGGSWDSYTDKDSYVLCLDAASGEVVWNVHRPSDANGESFDSYTTAVPYNSGGHEAIVVQGGDYVTGHDVDTGKELWRQGHNPRQGRMDRLIPSPVVAGDLVLGLQPRGLHAFAFRPGEKTKYTLEDSAWMYEERTSDVPCPIYYQGRIYIVKGVRKSMVCLEPETGREIWSEELDADSRIWASPTAADGKIYCLTEKGQVVVVAAGDTFKVHSRIAMGSAGPAKSSIAIADGSLFIRTAKKLYCVGASGGGS